MLYFDRTALQSPGSSHLETWAIGAILIFLVFRFFSFLCCYSVSGLFYFYTPEICQIPNGPDQNHKAVNTSLGFPSGAERPLRALGMCWETVPGGR